jgi:hypothetical protein
MVLLTTNFQVIGAIFSLIMALLHVFIAAFFDEEENIDCSDQDDRVVCKLVFYQFMNGFSALLWVIVSALQWIIFKHSRQSEQDTSMNTCTLHVPYSHDDVVEQATCRGRCQLLK